MVLAAVGRVLKQTMRISDLAARWGGEEFVVALTSTDLEGGRIAAERTRVCIEALHVTDPTGARIPLTASVGLASRLPEETVEQLMDRADHAMYAAKAAGRNRVGVDESTDLPGTRSGVPFLEVGAPQSVLSHMARPSRAS
jgi:two-component system cell cycle response regulator